MSWLYSRALVAEFSEATCSVGELFALSSANPTPQAFCAPDKTTAFSRLSRFGMTYALLTESRGEELLMWFRAGFPARTSALPERAQDSTASDQGCGEKWRGSWAKFDPDTFSWRTRQHSLLGGLDEYSETWPRSGLMRRGECYPLRTWAHRTSEKESGLWPTPSASDPILERRAEHGEHYITGTGTVRRKNADGTSSNLGLPAAVRMWPTPTTNDSHNWTLPPSQIKHDNIPGAMLRRGEGRPGGVLNPTWVEWLIGWPLEWTALNASGTDKFQQWRQQHSLNLPKPCPVEAAA